MVHAARQAASVAVLLLSLLWADGSEVNQSLFRGLDPDADAAYRRTYQKGQSAWNPSYLKRMRKLRNRWKPVAPIYFYRRTCGSGPPARQIIIPAGRFELSAILKDDASQMAFLLYVRWLIEAYWRLVVPAYWVEPKPLFIVDFEGLGWRSAIANSIGIHALIKKVNAAFHGITGKGWSKTYIINAPSCFSSIWKAVTTFCTFRNEGVVIVGNEAGNRELVEFAGEQCLWKGFGGKSKVPLGGGVVEKAFSDFSETDDDEADNMDIVRLSHEAEGFPGEDDVKFAREKIAGIVAERLQAANAIVPRPVSTAAEGGL